MQVILLERVEKLGLMGDVVTVKPGFARNYLLPKKIALRATQHNIALFETKKLEFEATNLKRKEEAQQIAQKVQGTKIIIVRPASEMGQLYGSVRARDIADALKAQGFTIDPSQVVIQTPIKVLGQHALSIRLHPEVFSEITAFVALSSEEAEEQIQRLKKSEAPDIKEELEAAETAVMEETLKVEA